ncbi:hypothetical protein V6N13_028413 [Hibiscus sabdariffa]
MVGLLSYGTWTQICVGDCWHTVSSTGTEVNSLPQNLKAETVKLGGGLGIGEAIDKERSKLWIRWNITS